MKSWWLTPNEFNSEYELVWSIFPHIKRRDRKKIELAECSPEELYKKGIEQLKTRIKNLIPDILFIYPYSGCDTLTTFGEHCIMVDTLADMKREELEQVKKTVKESNKLDFIRADWKNPPFRKDLDYNLIFKRSSSDTEEELEADLRNLDSQQLLPKSVIFFDPGYYAPLFGSLREATRSKDVINGYKIVGIFAVRPEIREVLQNPNGGTRDAVIVYNRSIE